MCPFSEEIRGKCYILSSPARPFLIYAKEKLSQLGLVGAQAESFWVQPPLRGEKPLSSELALGSVEATRSPVLSQFSPFEGSEGRGEKIEKQGRG